MTSIINTKRNVYALKFRNSVETYIFSTDEQLNEILRLPNTEYGIDSIKVFDNAKSRFKRASKKDLKTWFSWNTEAMQILNRVNFFNQ